MGSTTDSASKTMTSVVLYPPVVDPRRFFCSVVSFCDRPRAFLTCLLRLVPHRGSVSKYRRYVIGSSQFPDPDLYPICQRWDFTLELTHRKIRAIRLHHRKGMEI